MNGGRPEPGAATPSGNADLELEHEQIAAALDEFWLERAASAPEASTIKEHLQEEEDYLVALLSDGN